MTIHDRPRTCCRMAAVAAMLLFSGCRSSDPAGRTASALRAESPGRAAGETPAAPAANEAAEQDGSEVYSNTVKWTTASELDNFGYDVYRGEAPDGPFERLNPEVVEGAGTTDEPTRYRYVDDRIDPHKTYYYYVESISMSGIRERFTPIGMAPPKISPAEAGDRP